MAGASEAKTRAAVLLLQFVALAVCLWVIEARLVPAASSDTTFATYYTAARVVVDTPADLPRLYTETWFNDRLHAEGFAHLNDIFNLNPPTAAVMAAPLAAMSVETGRWVWPLANLGGLGVGVLLLARAFTLSWPWVLPLIALAALTEPVGQQFDRNQVYLIFFALVCWLVSAWVRGDRTQAGALLGAIAALKTLCGWVVLQRLVARDARTIAGVGSSAVVIGALGVLATGPDVWGVYLSRLPELFTAPQRYVTAYQTTVSLFGHLFVFDPAWNPAPIANLPWLAGLATVAVFLASLVISVRCEPGVEAGLDVRALHIAMALALVVANGPLGEDYHYVLVLPSLFVGWRHLACVPAPWASRAVLSLATLALVAPWDYKSAELSQGAWALLAYPRVYGAYLLWGWLVAALGKAQGTGQ